MEFGLAASIVTIIGASAKTVKYLQDVKDAPPARRKLAVEVASLLSLLTDLQYRVEGAKANEPWLQGVQSLAVENGPLDQVRGVMEDLARKLRPVGKLKGSVRALIWTFDKEKTDDMLSKINRVNMQISIALQKDQFALSLRTDKQVEGVDGKVHDIADGVSALRLDQKEAALTGRRRLMAEWISPLDFHHIHNAALSSRQSDTGKWFLESEQFKQWLQGTSKALWCPGMPGAGKTVIAAIAIDHVQKRYTSTKTGMAYIYCNYKEQSEQTSVNLVGSLLQQLAQQNPSILDNLTSIYEHHSSKNTRPALHEISKVFQSTISSFKNVFIVIDALDECCEENGSRDGLLESLGALVDNARFMFTSRPNVRINKGFPYMQELEIIASNEDVRTYLDARILQTPRLVRIIRSHLDLKDMIADTISNNVEGMFLLARFHMDSVSNKRSRNELLKALPNLSSSLEGAYNEALERIDAQGKDDRQLAMKVIYWITLAKVPLTVRELQHALAVKPRASRLDEGDIVDEETLLSVCAGLITIEPKSHIVRLVHFTTQDYFRSIQKARYPDIHAEIATACLTYLLFEDFATGPCASDMDFLNRLEVNAFLDYSARYWGEHTREVEDAVEIPVLELLQDKSRLSSYAQVTHVPEYKYEGFSQYFPRGVSGLQVAAASGLNQTIYLLLEKGVDVEAKDSHGWTALILAAWGGHEAVVRLLLEKGADVEAKDSEGRTALIWAARGGHEAVARLLLEKGADVEVEAEDSRGRTALIWAAWEGHEAVVRLLLEKGADVEAKDSDGRTALIWAAAEEYDRVLMQWLEEVTDFEAKDNRGRTARYGAAGRGHEAVVRQLLEKGADVEAKGSWGGTALHEVAQGGREAVVRQLLEKGADVEAEDSHGRMALIWAASEGHEAVVRLLLEKGADVEAKDSEGMTALYGAAGGGHEAVVRLLLEKGADVEAKNSEGRTALSWAAEEGYEAVVRQLLQNGANVEAKDSKGWTALGWASVRAREAVIPMLLEKGAEVGGKDSNAWTALGSPAEEGHKAVVQLLGEGADIEAKDSRRRSILRRAAEEGHDAVVRLLLEKGADVEAKDSEGRTALYGAAEEGHDTVVRQLLEKGADVEAKDSQGRTALYGAARGGHEAVVRQLLEKGADVEAKDSQGRTALHEAAEEGREAVVRQLLGKGADVEAKNSWGGTALHEAAEEGREAVVRQLLGKGADVEAKDSQGRTALHEAAGGGHEAVVQLLLEKGADVEAKDRQGRTAPYVAALEGHEAVVRRLRSVSQHGS
ncbi:MAG: hypothetical protein M1824_001849 [Vezdaea acicularis]|nr:MAG: hypothetical protein M1824_001849 [Vezdaea acicularis]